MKQTWKADSARNTRYWLFGVTLVALTAWGACSSDEQAEEDGAGATGGTGGKPDTGAGTGGGGTGGTGGGAALMCGANECPPPPAVPAGSGITITACCTATEECGLSTPLVDHCTKPEPNAGVDPSCPSVSIASAGVTLLGCCHPSGQCGGFSDLLGLGCISETDLGEDLPACTYDPTNRCRYVNELPCDGAEDCPGQKCCGHFEGGAYTEFACMDECTFVGQEGWLELCHPGQTCTEPSYVCEASNYLPGFMFRCYEAGMGLAPGDPGSTAAGEINCGTSLCGAGEKCCLREPGEMYCAPVAETCVCNPDAGAGGAAGAGAGGAAGGIGSGGFAGGVACLPSGNSCSVTSECCQGLTCRLIAGRPDGAPVGARTCQ